MLRYEKVALQTLRIKKLRIEKLGLSFDIENFENAFQTLRIEKWSNMDFSLRIEKRP